MKPKTTAIWFALAASLFAFIWIFNNYLQPRAVAVVGLLPGLRAADVAGIQVSPAGATEISAVRTDGAWLLQKPLAYPAQAAAVEALAGALEKLVPASRLSASDLRGHKNADAEFGFDNPQFSLAVAAGNQRHQLMVGHRTAPGDQVFVRVGGEDSVFVTDVGWLNLLPRTAADWRDTALVGAAGTCDWVVVTNGTKAMEFRRDPAGLAWRMVRPLQARADNERIAAALQQLRAARTVQFITDDPRADLSSYGLQPADLAVWLGQGTNLADGIEAGNAPPTNSTLLFARRAGWGAVVAANKDAFAGWRGGVNDYRDPHLFTPGTPPGEIEVRGENNFTLQQHGSTNWDVAGESFPADADNVQAFLKMLASLRVSEFVKDGNTATNIQEFGLVAPAHQITLRAAPGDTNAPLVQLLFGTVETNRVLVKRADEDFVYAITPADYNSLFLFNDGWYYRDRRIWDFSETNVAQVTLRQSGKLRQLVRTGENKWSIAAGNGMINPPAVEETIHRLGQLTAAGWVGRNITEPEKYGLATNNLAVTIELKTGEKWQLDFGVELPQSQTALAAVTYGAGRWAFVFPPVLYQFVANYLTIPANVP